jgi:hypothetical protein
MNVFLGLTSGVEGRQMGRIVFRNGWYYEEPWLDEPLENGRVLFDAQLKQDLIQARWGSKGLKASFPGAKAVAAGILLAVVALLIVWALISCTHWFWFHSLW